MSAFVAISPPDPVGRDLAAALDAVRDAPSDVPEGLRWTAEATWHLTVTFLGRLEEERRAALLPRLERAARRHSPFDLSLAGAGAFGSHVLFTRVRADVEALHHLAGSVSAAARRVGAVVEDRPYRPHLTLARARGRVSLRPLVDRLGAYAGPPWTVDAISLLESRPSGVANQPPAYAVLGRFPLRGGVAEHE